MPILKITCEEIFKHDSFLHAIPLPLPPPNSYEKSQRRRNICNLILYNFGLTFFFVFSEKSKFAPPLALRGQNMHGFQTSSSIQNTYSTASEYEILLSVNFDTRVRVIFEQKSLNQIVSQLYQNSKMKLPAPKNGQRCLLR